MDPNNILLGNRYELLELIGAGGMALVYRARDLLLDRIVAIKILKPEFTEDAQFIERFRVEAQAAASLSNANIVMIYDVGQDIGPDGAVCYYIIMEHVDGITLRDYIANTGGIGWKEAANLAIQITQAIDSAHQNNIIHRDVKPHNILITRDRKIKVTDFGIARAASSTTITTVGNAMGSVHYFSPEQAKGALTDGKSDIYSLGVTLYEMLTGVVPFDGDTPIAVALKHIQEEPVPPSARNPQVPPAMSAVVLRAIAKDKFERYQSAGEMLLDLRRALKDPGGESLSATAWLRASQQAAPAAAAAMNGAGMAAAQYAAGQRPQYAAAPQAMPPQGMYATGPVGQLGMQYAPQPAFSPVPVRHVYAGPGGMPAYAQEAAYADPAYADPAYAGQAYEDQAYAAEQGYAGDGAYMARGGNGARAPHGARGMRGGRGARGARGGYGDGYADGAGHGRQRGNPHGGGGAGGGADRRNMALVVVTIVAVVGAIGFMAWLFKTLSDGLDPNTGPTSATGLAEAEDFVVGEYRDKDFDAVSEQLRENNIVAVRNDVPSDRAAGSIIRQSVESGRKLPKDGRSSIEFEVSVGPDRVAVADYAGKDRRIAEEELSKKLHVTILEEQSETIGSGLVIRTDPPAFSSLTAGDEITVYVSSGSDARPERASVPQLIGKTFLEVNEIMASSEFKLGILSPSSPRQTAIVVSQYPQPNTLSDVTVSINLWFEEAEETTTQPTTEEESTETSETETEATTPETTTEPTTEETTTAPTEPPTTDPANTQLPSPGVYVTKRISINLPSSQEFGDTLRLIVEVTPSDTGKMNRIVNKRVNRTDFPYSVEISIPVGGTTLIKASFDGFEVMKTWDSES